MRQRRRRELFPPDRGLQARRVVAAALTPAMVVGAVGAIVWFAPVKMIGALALAAFVGGLSARAASLRSAQERELTAADAPEVHAIVERLCIAGDLPEPRLVLEYERQPNSWIVDRPGRPPALHLTRGLLDALDGDELEAVIAHELSHLAHRDALVMTAVGGPGAVLLQGGSRVIRFGWFGMVGGAVAVSIGSLARFGTSALSRYRELAADAGSAALTGRPAALATALRKLSGELARVPSADLRVAAGRDAFHLLPVGSEGGRLDRLVGTHPSLEKRLARLDALERRMHQARAASPPGAG